MADADPDLAAVLRTAEGTAAKTAKEMDAGLGGSMRITFAPQSAKWRTQVGPARASVRSSTVMRDSGSLASL